MPQYRRFTTGPWRKSSKWRGVNNPLFRLLTFWIPKSNPDFEDKFSEVHFFWLEIDDNGQVSREIGFNSADLPVTAAPLGKNLGIFTDLEGAPEQLEAQVSSDEFERNFSKIKVLKGLV